MPSGDGESELETRVEAKKEKENLRVLEHAAPRREGCRGAICPPSWYSDEAPDDAGPPICVSPGYRDIFFFIFFFFFLGGGGGTPGGREGPNESDMSRDPMAPGGLHTHPWISHPSFSFVRPRPP